MLEKLLALVARGGPCTPAWLARELGVSPALVEAMLADLTRAGYLQAVEGCAGGQCASCGSASGLCRPRGAVWRVVRR